MWFCSFSIECFHEQVRGESFHFLSLKFIDFTRMHLHFDCFGSWILNQPFNIFSIPLCKFHSVHFSRSVVYDLLWRHGLQHAMLPCPSPIPGVYSNSCPLSRWCHPTISSSVVPFSSHLQFFPASGSFQMSQFFESGGQNTGVSVSASVLPMNIQDWLPLGYFLPYVNIDQFFKHLYIIKNVRRQSTEWEKILTNHISDQRFLCGGLINIYWINE